MITGLFRFYPHHKPPLGDGFSKVMFFLTIVM
jgi:hypothetical protein